MSELDKINEIVDWAKSELDKIDLSVYGAKKKVVQEAAIKLEGLIENDGIAEELAHQLKDKISKSVIYEALDDKYKHKKRVEAQKKAKESLSPKPDLALPRRQPMAVTTLGSQEPSFTEKEPRSVQDRNDSFTMGNLPSQELRERVAKLEERLTNMEQPYEFTYDVETPNGQFLPVTVKTFPGKKSGIVTVDRHKLKEMLGQ